MRTPFRKNHGKITFVLYNKPSPCGGNCLYCFSIKGFTKSTTSNEDTLLARNSGWDGSRQLSERFKRYGLVKGSGVKCDLAIKGESFASYDHDYLRQYTKDIYDYLNNNTSVDLKEASRIQGTAPDRCVTFKVETRPDQIDIDKCRLFIELGITTVELGVQSLNNHVLEYNHRGHDTEAVKKATSLLRQFGFEVCYQMMVGLPGSNKSIDEEILTETLWEEEYSPDALKIYPCLLLKASVTKQKRIRQLYNKKIWKALTDQEYIYLLNECYPKIPPYVHINRIQRIIPYDKIDTGPSIQIDRRQFQKISRCLWQRSAAQRLTHLDGNLQHYRIINYSQGLKRYCFEAIFKHDIVLGYGRLDQFSDKSAIIRDIRVLGNMLPIGFSNNQKIGCQHTGIGTSILKAMERKAKGDKLTYIFIKPSFGTVEWFMNKGYETASEYYRVKQLTNVVNNYMEIREELQRIYTGDMVAITDSCNSLPVLTDPSH